MALTAILVPGNEGVHHAITTGLLTVGPGFGEVPAIGMNQLLRLRLPFMPAFYATRGYEEQFYVIIKSLDGAVTNVVLDPLEFEYDNVSSILRLRVSLTSAPAALQTWLESHHSVGR